ncbi:hypothetical protein X801_03958 [Opisthorchis viverrini]|uniref:Reverse transcriptase domain-containing protein n=1 Tax=Opisthorchis viverrini TaxID=6198 RepID=A0A1S8X0C5_OPIVI|nr:hypothetical protein X801_03958 [Opisthorchis viverrini]
MGTPILPTLKPDGTVRICARSVHVSTHNEDVIAGIPKTFVYLDDILIPGCTMEEHSKSLKVVLDRLKEGGLRTKKENCDFLVDHVDYVG